MGVQNKEKKKLQQIPLPTIKMELPTESGTTTAANFEDKRRMLFASLETAEKQCLKGTNLEKLAKTNEHGTKQLAVDVDALVMVPESDLIKSRKHQGKQSIFKRPELPITKCLKSRRPNPDYSVRYTFYLTVVCKSVSCYIYIHISIPQINPHKWQKYSLNDADISDRTNTAAAFTFLKELAERNSLTNEEDLLWIDSDESNSSRPIKFNKRKSDDGHHSSLAELKDDLDGKERCDATSTMKGTKVLASEYVVGQPKPKFNKSKRMRNDAGKVVPSSGTVALRLDHLLDDEDECDEE